MKKIVILISILLISNIFILQTESQYNKYGFKYHNKPFESHIIENVPYISQETSFYCFFACPAMAIKYLKINTTLQEVIFNSGVGYSMVYPSPSFNHVPMGGNGAARWKLDRKFLADLYGLSYEEIRISTDSNNENHWNIFFNKLKENISNDYPVILKSDPLFLPSLRNPILKELGLKNHDFYDSFFRLIPPGFVHIILVVGFNEIDKTILYHDAMSSVSDYPEEGIYASISMDEFRTAITRVARNSNLTFGIFTDQDSEPMNKSEIFNTAHYRNIEKMKGNESVYDEDVYITKPVCYGINGLKELKNDLTGLKNQICTSLIYRFNTFFHLSPVYNIIFTLSDIFIPKVYNMDDWQALSNYFFQLSVEKHNISQYLLELSFEFNNSDLVDLCKYESNLLKQESIHWEVLGKYFNVFMKRGLFLSLPISLILINKMKNIVEDIIKIQEQIIMGPLLL